MLHGLWSYFTYFQKRKKQISTLIFLWLHNQIFYKKLQNQALEPIASTKQKKQWADIGCSTGLMSRLAWAKHYEVVGYDLNYFSLLVAKVLSFNKKNLRYEQKDFRKLETSFDIITATSLLSVIPNKEEALNALIDLLKDDAILILIEPTEHLTRENVWKKITNLKSFWYYKGLLLWAKAREGKDLDKKIFDNILAYTIEHHYALDNMVRISYISKI